MRRANMAATACVFLLLLASCAHKQINVFANGAPVPSNFVHMVTADGEIHVFYHYDAYEKVKVDDESMLWPNALSHTDENIRVGSDIESVVFQVRIINPKNREYRLVYKYRTMDRYTRVEKGEKIIIYEGKLPFRDFAINCPMIRGRVKVWAELWEGSQLLGFTQALTFKR